MRIILFTLCLLVLLSSIWISLGNESNIIIEWLGYHVEISTIFATIFLLITLIILFLIIYFLIFLKNIPSSLRKHYYEKQNHDNLLLLLDCFSSLHSEDLTLVKKNIKKLHANKNHSQIQELNPIVSLLITKFYELTNSDNLEESYQKLIQYQSYKLIGLKGLIALRIQKKCYHEALAYAEKAFLINPKSSWLLSYLIEIYTALDLYEKAEYIIHEYFRYKFVNKKDYKAMLTKNLLEHANYLIANLQKDKAISLLEKALKLQPSYYEAVATLARLYSQNNDKKLAYKIIQKAWINLPSIMLAHLIVNISQDETINKKVQLLENLIDKKPDAKEGYIVLAELYIKEDMLAQGRAVMDQLLALHAPDSETCKLMALIEAKAHNNHSIIINWLHRL
ncbi:MAG: hypothetical protein N4A31_05780 [Rickettsiales bacterium]|nr:hypothetical protein [Rickettsiales bacterium]